MPVLKIKQNGKWVDIAGGGGAGSIDIDLEGAITGEASSINADTLGGKPAGEYALKADLDNIGSGSGVSSWNDLTDKPFGDLSNGSNTVTWDEIMDGKVNADGELFKVSDALPTENDLVNGYTITFADGSISHYHGDGIHSTDALLIEQGNNFTVIYDPVAATAETVYEWHEPGVYLYYCDPYVKPV